MNSRCASKIARVLPSLTDVAFLLPLFLMLARMNGVKAVLCDADTGWHLRTGEWILAHNAVPHSDLFSFSRAGEPWFAWEWMWDVLFALLYRWGGLAAVALVCMVMISFTYALMFRLLRRRVNALLAMGLTVLATAGSAVHWIARPHLVTILLALVFHAMLERVREGRGSLPERWGGVPLLAVMPVIMILWTNLHAGFFVGITLVAAYAIGALIRTAMETEGVRRAEAWSQARQYLWCVLACAGASLVNPYSVQLHRHLAGYLNLTYETTNIVEFRSLSFHHPLAPFFEIMLGLGLAAALWSAARRRFEHTVVVLVWAHAALLAARNIPVFMSVAALVAAQAASEWAASWETAVVPEWLGRLRRRVSLIGATLRAGENLPRIHVVSAAAVLLLVSMVYAPAPPKLFRPEYDPQLYPAAAIHSAALRDPAARTFTSDEWGDYLIFRLYPDTKVFIDGRSDFYGAEFGNRYLDVWRVKYDWEQTMARYGINTILLPPTAALAGALKESRRWRLVYDDGVALIFRRAETPGAGAQVSAADAGGEMGRDREITKTEARDRTITHLHNNGPNI